jgi:hypothetical protein
VTTTQNAGFHCATSAIQPTGGSGASATVFRRHLHSLWCYNKACSRMHFCATRKMASCLLAHPTHSSPSS